MKRRSGGGDTWSKVRRAFRSPAAGLQEAVVINYTFAGLELDPSVVGRFSAEPPSRWTAPVVSEYLRAVLAKAGTEAEAVARVRQLEITGPALLDAEAGASIAGGCPEVARLFNDPLRRLRWLESAWQSRAQQKANTEEAVVCISSSTSDAAVANELRCAIAELGAVRISQADSDRDAAAVAIAHASLVLVVLTQDSVVDPDGSRGGQR